MAVRLVGVFFWKALAVLLAYFKIMKLFCTSTTRLTTPFPRTPQAHSVWGRAYTSGRSDLIVDACLVSMESELHMHADCSMVSSNIRTCSLQVMV